MSSPTDKLRELFQETAAYLEILRSGGFCSVDGTYDFRRPASQPNRPASSGKRPGASRPASLSSSQRERLKAEMLNPYAGMAPAMQRTAPANSEPSSPAESAQPAAPKERPDDKLTPENREAALKQIAAAETLEDIAALVSRCFMCRLSASRTHTVPGEGNPDADLVFVGEAPGYNEDMQGRPFVGRAGKLLDDMIKAMGHQRGDVFIGNICKCRPPNNRDPQPDEMKACEPFLQRQLAMLRPRVICALGRVAVQSLLRDTSPISKIRGRWRAYNDIPLMPTFHPAYLLRNAGQKGLVWEDLQAVMARLE